MYHYVITTIIGLWPQNEIVGKFTGGRVGEWIAVDDRSWAFGAPIYIRRMGSKNVKNGLQSKKLPQKFAQEK